MSQAVALTLTLLIVINPAGLILRWRMLGAASTVVAAVLACVVAIIALIATALLGPDILKLLETPEATFQVGAGLLLLFDAARTVLQREPFNPQPYPPTGNDQLVAGGRMAITTATPAALALAAFYGADRGEGDTVAALAIAGVLSVAVLVAGLAYNLAPWRVPVRELGRATAAILGVLAVDLIIDGVIAV